jgi:multidrug efflux pump subunit AcrB
VTILFTFLLFAVSLWGMRFVPQQFFPASDRPELLVDVKLAQNASIHASREAASRIDAALRDDPDVARWSTYVGRGAVRFYLPLDVQLQNDSISQLVIVAKDLEARERLRKRLEALVETALPQAVTRISPLEMGPPVGWPLQYRVTGPDIVRLREVAQTAAEVVASSPLTRQLNYSWGEPARVLRVAIDQDQARLLGLGSRDLAQVLNAVMTGSTVTQLRDDI